jgi:hypothetical protein
MRKVISYCIWGDNKLYNYGIYENALLLNKIFPDWYMVVYYTKTALVKVIEEIKKIKNVECIPVNLPNHPRNSMLRFLAGFNKNNDVVIFRDADSRLIQRDADAVKEWLDNTNNSIHIIRDNETHKKICAGLFGVRNRVMCNKDIIAKYYEYFNLSDSKWSIDEKFLNQVIYPKYINDATIHAEFNRDELNATGFPSHCVSRTVDGFCGMTQGKTLNAFKQFNEVVVVHKKERCL